MALVLATAVGGAAGCSAAKTVEVAAAISVETVAARSGSIESAIEVTGVLVPANTATVSSKMSGAVLEVNGEVGRQVSVGDVMVKLDTKELDAQLQSAQAALDSARSQSEIAEVGVKTAESGLDATQAAVDATQAAVDDQIEAARVALNSAQVGLSSANTALLSVQKQSDLQLEQAQNNLDTAQKNHDRVKPLYDSQFISQSDMDAANTALTSAQTAYDLTAQAAKTALENAQAAVDSAKARYDSAKVQYDTASGSAAQGQLTAINGQLTAAQGQLNIARKQYDVSSTSTIKNAEAAVNAINVQLQNALITAAINGIIVNKNVNPGEIAVAGAPLFTLADVSRLKLKGTVSQDALLYIKQGEPVGVTVDIYPDRIFDGVVDSLGPIAVSTGSYFPCEIAIENADLSVAAGLSARASIGITGDSGRVIAPNAALSESGSQAFVYVVADGAAHKRDVVTGLKNDAETEILHGLEQGEFVAVSNTGALFDGMPVTEARRG